MLKLLGAQWAPLVSRLVDALDVTVGGSSLRLDLDAASTFLDMVVRWNDKHDLTAARSAEELVDLYFADAFVLRSACGPGKWVDIGSGGGAPGLSAAFFQPQPAITLVEPRAKRVAFLRSAVGRFDLGAFVSVQKARCEELEHGVADIAISRATFAPDEWLSRAARLALTEVWVLLARGAEPALPGWAVSTAIAYRWPLTGAERRAVRYQPTVIR